MVLECDGGFATLLKAAASSIARICLIQNSCPPLAYLSTSSNDFLLLGALGCPAVSY